MSMIISNSYQYFFLALPNFSCYLQIWRLQCHKIFSFSHHKNNCNQFPHIYVYRSDTVTATTTNFAQSYWPLYKTYHLFAYIILIDQCQVYELDVNSIAFYAIRTLVSIFKFVINDHQRKTAVCHYHIMFSISIISALWMSILDQTLFITSIKK